MLEFLNPENRNMHNNSMEHNNGNKRSTERDEGAQNDGGDGTADDRRMDQGAGSPTILSAEDVGGSDDQEAHPKKQRTG